MGVILLATLCYSSLCVHLQNRNGFMSKFYQLSSVLLPVFVWGFLGTNQELQQRCLRFKERKYTLVNKYLMFMPICCSLYSCRRKCWTSYRPFSHWKSLDTRPSTHWLMTLCFTQDSPLTFSLTFSPCQNDHLLVSQPGT